MRVVFVLMPWQASACDGDDDGIYDGDVVVDGDVDCVRQEEVREQEREAEMRDLEILLADR